MAAQKVVLAHGAMTSALDMIVSLGPVLLGSILLFAFILLLAGDRRSRAKARARGGWRDERPTSARLFFSGAYFELDRLTDFDFDADARYTPEAKTAAAR